MQPLPLWPVMFYDVDWADHSKHRQQLIDYCYALEREGKTSQVAPGAKYGLYESKFNFCDSTDPAVQELTTFFKQSIFQAAKHANTEYWQPGMNIQINIHESWCHITRDGGYHDTHTHPNSSWSLIYYLELGDMDHEKKNGLNRFYNPNNSMYLDAGTAWNTADNSIDIRAEAGQAILFPSWIQHSALPYRGTKDRLVIAANARIEVVV